MGSGRDSKICRKEYDTASGNGRDFKITSVVTRHSLPSWSIHISGQPISENEDIPFKYAHTYYIYTLPSTVLQSSHFQLTRKKRNNI